MEVSIKLKNVQVSQYCVKKGIFNRIIEVISNNTVQKKTNNTEERKELHKLFTKTDKNEDEEKERCAQHIRRCYNSSEKTSIY